MMFPTLSRRCGRCDGRGQVPDPADRTRDPQWITCPACAGDGDVAVGSVIGGIARPDLKPWPADAIMIVSAPAGEELREQMEGVAVVACRDCGRTLHADTMTIRRAETLPHRRGRPVKFFCPPCHTNYDLGRCTHIIEHNKTDEEE